MPTVVNFKKTWIVETEVADGLQRRQVRSYRYNQQKEAPLF